MCSQIARDALAKCRNGRVWGRNRRRRIDSSSQTSTRCGGRNIPTSQRFTAVGETKPWNKLVSYGGRTRNKRPSKAQGLLNYALMMAQRPRPSLLHPSIPSQLSRSAVKSQQWTQARSLVQDRRPASLRRSPSGKHRDGLSAAPRLTRGAVWYPARRHLLRGCVLKSLFTDPV